MKTVLKIKYLSPLNSGGNKTPLYFIHGGGEHFTKLSNLASYMDSRQPVYGLEAIGARGDVEPIPDIPAIASVYVSEILLQNPEGPYCIAGYSFGGIIAFEVATQLKSQDRRVNLLALLDSYGEQPRGNLTSSRQLIEKLAYQILNISFKIKKTLLEPVSVIRFYKQYKLPGWRKAFLTRIGNRQPETTPTEINAVLDRVGAANSIALANYYLSEYPGDIDLFRSSNQMYYLKDSKFLGWKKFAKGSVRVHNIPGDHFNIFDPPNDIKLARIIQYVLDKQNALTDS